MCFNEFCRWTPKGQLIAHINEHKNSINRYMLNDSRVQALSDCLTASLPLSLSLPFPPLLQNLCTIGQLCICHFLWRWYYKDLGHGQAGGQEPRQQGKVHLFRTRWRISMEITLSYNYIHFYLYTGLGGQIKAGVFCHGQRSVAAASSTGSIQVFRWVQNQQIPSYMHITVHV